jgi:arylsulfatase A-like enzyme
MAVEDPDVLYTDLGECDTAQHIFGAADHPEEWVDPGTPDVLWDDVSVFNARANRDPILDVVYEADVSFGLMLDVLQARGVLDRSLVVLLSDHGQATVMSARGTVLDVGKILSQAGVGETETERIVAFGQLGSIAVRDPASRAHIEQVLKDYEILHPVLHTPVKPFFVTNREEMDSGFSAFDGAFGQDNVAGNRRGELYSEWCVDSTLEDPNRVRWPDLFVLTRDHFQHELISSDDVVDSRFGTPFAGHHGSRDTQEVILGLRGPGIRPGVYGSAASLADIAPTLYRLLGLLAPGNVDGKVLEQVLAP